MADLVGQDSAAKAVKLWLESERPQPLLIAGASGTGKTTIARIIGATYLCESTDAPCGECKNCVQIFEGRPAIGYSEFNGAKSSSAEDAKYITKSIDEAVLWRWTTFVDEAHGLSKAGADVLLKPIEDPNRDVRIVFATTEPQNVRRTLRGRCQLVQLRTLNSADLYELLAKVCAAEEIQYEPRALDMIAAVAEGAARDALVQLDGIADLGPVTTELVAECLSLGNAASVLKYFRAVLAADVDAQDEAILQWQTQPQEIVKLIRDFLLYIYNFEARAKRSSDIVNAAFFEVLEADRIAIASGFRHLASSRARAFPDFMLDMMEQWEGDPGNITDRSSLMIKVCRFDRLLHGDAPQPVSPEIMGKVTADLPEKAKPRRRRISQGPKSADSNYLNLKQCENMYDMASFLVQEHGVFLNTKITIRQCPDAVGNAKVPPLVSEVTHALAQRAKAWSNAPAHWIYVNAKDEQSVVTRLGLHLPRQALAKVEPWLESWRDKADPKFKLETEYDVQAANRAEGFNHNRNQRHWWIFRWLASAIHPDILHWSDQEELSSRSPLVDLLNIAKPDRYIIGSIQNLNALGGSQSLGPAARRKAADGRMPFLSAFADCAWEVLQSGWELDEHNDRLVETVRRSDQMDRLQKEYPPAATQLERDAYHHAVARMQADWPALAHDRPRSREGWW
ncbi:AAA family ATPase [Pontixanthobacter aquaemixtae]|uniref:AAA family ATPase n=1 Tax=Pontixanthobacter aquaemixtae TaxID=1958940 RepID=A0A844ZWE1_9SPHN|nr:AAA family ATPase [Pontixanthobacter aquaemixtae]MXO91500.1 AAA family ATPase [Pontixanthobacter aquaemixtae]